MRVDAEMLGGLRAPHNPDVLVEGICGPVPSPA